LDIHVEEAAKLLQGAPATKEQRKDQGRKDLKVRPVSGIHETESICLGMEQLSKDSFQMVLFLGEGMLVN